MCLAIAAAFFPDQETVLLDLSQVMTCEIYYYSDGM